MRVPNAEMARVDLAKVLDYLLSDTHPVGQSKARFFRSLGFSREAPQELIEALLKVVNQGDCQDHRVTLHGSTYVVDGIVVGRLRKGRVRTVWVIEDGQVAPRLVTAYPETEVGT